MICEESRRNQKQGNLELGKYRIVEKKNRRNANACTKNGCRKNPCRLRRKRKEAINHMVEQCKYLYKSITTFSDMIELVMFSI